MKSIYQLLSIGFFLCFIHNNGRAQTVRSITNDASIYALDYEGDITCLFDGSIEAPGCTFLPNSTSMILNVQFPGTYYVSHFTARFNDGEIEFWIDGDDWDVRGYGSNKIKTEYIRRNTKSLQIRLYYNEDRLDIDEIEIYGYLVEADVIDYTEIYADSFQNIDDTDTSISFSEPSIISLKTSGKERMRVGGNSVVIGEKRGLGGVLSVGGVTYAEEARTKLQSQWPDYVFKKNYKLLPLNDLKKFISANKHLPDLLPAHTMQEKAEINVSELSGVLLKKVEELTRYIFQIDNTQKSNRELIASIENSNEVEYRGMKVDPEISTPDLSIQQELVVNNRKVISSDDLISSVASNDVILKGRFFTDEKYLTNYFGFPENDNIVFTMNRRDIMKIHSNGNVAIGWTDYNKNGVLLSVSGKIQAERLGIKLVKPWPDYVFEPDYSLLSLSELEKFITKNKHLPGVKPAKEIETSQKVNIEELQIALLEKIEELTLYIIQLHEESDQLQKSFEALKVHNQYFAKR